MKKRKGGNNRGGAYDYVTAANSVTNSVNNSHVLDESVLFLINLPLMYVVDLTNNQGPCG